MATKSATIATSASQSNQTGGPGRTGVAATAGSAAGTGDTATPPRGGVPGGAMTVGLALRLRIAVLLSARGRVARALLLKYNGEVAPRSPPSGDAATRRLKTSATRPVPLLCGPRRATGAGAFPGQG